MDDIIIEIENDKSNLTIVICPYKVANKTVIYNHLNNLNTDILYNYHNFILMLLNNPQKIKTCLYMLLK